MPSEKSTSLKATAPTARAGTGESHHAETAQALPPAGATAAHSESTELERRVLAHERILQALIAHMAEIEPKFLIRLSDTFCVPMEMPRPEHDYTDSESYAADFVRSVLNLGEKATRNGSAAARAQPARKVAPRATAKDREPSVEPPRIQMTHVNGIWRVTIDGCFYGDFAKENDAAASVAKARRRRTDFVTDCSPAQSPRIILEDCNGTAL